MPHAVVFTGSSIIAFWESLPQFFPGITLLNTAVSGSQTHEIYAQLDELVIAHKPSVVCYYCGSNDINHAVSAQTIVKNVISTYETLKLQLGKVEFVYLSIIKAPQKRARWMVVDAVNTQLHQMTRALSEFRYIDVNPVFFTQDARPRTDFYEDDQLHLNSAAYLALGKYVAPRVIEIMNAMDSRKIY